MNTGISTGIILPDKMAKTAPVFDRFIFSGKLFKLYFYTMKLLRYISVLFILSTFTLIVSAQTTVWNEEAENAILMGTAEISEGCANASSNKFVKPGSAVNNGLLFNNINISSSGSYELKFYYFYVGESSLEVMVNGSSAGIFNFPTAVWCYQGNSSEFIITVTLIEGTNNLELKTANGMNAPFLDRLEIIETIPPREVPNVFYLSSTVGEDSNDGLSVINPWKSLEKISSTPLIPGDTVLFRSEDTFTGQLNIKGSGSTGKPVVIGRYGEGDLPVIDGANADGGAYLSALFVNNHDNIEISDLAIKNDRRISRTGVDDKYAYGIYVLNNGDSIIQNFRFRNLKISDVYAINTEGQAHDDLHMTGILFECSRNTVAGEEKNISDVVVEDCYITHIGKLGVLSRHRGGNSGIGNDSVNRNMNIVIRNNHFFETGGSGVVLSSTFNGLLENNIFEYPGSDYEPRMAKRGSAAWFWNSRNIIAQYNKSLHVRGPADSYSMHIDFGNRNVILQYNYSEDCEGGFV
ncbi:MAG: hypothetical protein J7L04_04200, partial [Bacteroidales bacterium]|nr:hypothetical protein [Bacteroidales bacterium]